MAWCLSFHPKFEYFKIGEKRCPSCSSLQHDNWLKIKNCLIVWLRTNVYLALDLIFDILIKNPSKDGEKTQIATLNCILRIPINALEMSCWINFTKNSSNIVWLRSQEKMIQIVAIVCIYCTNNGTRRQLKRASETQQQQQQQEIKMQRTPQTQTHISGRTKHSENLNRK